MLSWDTKIHTHSILSVEPFNHWQLLSEFQGLIQNVNMTFSYSLTHFLSLLNQMQTLQARIKYEVLFKKPRMKRALEKVTENGMTKSVGFVAVKKRDKSTIINLVLNTPKRYTYNIVIVTKFFNTSIEVSKNYYLLLPVKLYFRL